MFVWVGKEAGYDVIVIGRVASVLAELVGHSYDSDRFCHNYVLTVLLIFNNKK